MENARRIFLAAFVATVEASLAGIIITCGGGDALGNNLMFCAVTSLDVHSVSALVMWVVLVLFAFINVFVVVLVADVVSVVVALVEVFVSGLEVSKTGSIIILPLALAVSSELLIIGCVVVPILLCVNLIFA